eukprot:5154055-Prymnesium_polylepis.1
MQSPDPVAHVERSHNPSHSPQRFAYSHLPLLEYASECGMAGHGVTARRPRLGALGPAALDPRSPAA